MPIKIEVILNYTDPASGYDLFYAIPRFTSAGNDVSDIIEILQDTVVISDASEPGIQNRTKYTFDAEMHQMNSIGNPIIVGDFSIAFMDGDTYEDKFILYGGTARFN